MDRNRMDRRRSEYRRTVGTSRLTPEQRAAERRQAARRNRAARGGNDVLDRRMDAARMRAVESARRASRANGMYRGSNAGSGRTRAGSDRPTGRSSLRSQNRASVSSGRGRGSVSAVRDIHRGANRGSARRRLDEGSARRQIDPPKPPIRKMASATMSGASAAVDFVRRGIVSPLGGAVSSSLEGRKRDRSQVAASRSRSRETVDQRTHSRKSVQAGKRVEGRASAAGCDAGARVQRDAGRWNDSNAPDESTVADYALNHEDARRVPRVDLAGVRSAGTRVKDKAAAFASGVSGRFGEKAWQAGNRGSRQHR